MRLPAPVCWTQLVPPLFDVSILPYEEQPASLVPSEDMAAYEIFKPLLNVVAVKGKLSTVIGQLEV
jgi:hypothetical protein